MKKHTLAAIVIVILVGITLATHTAQTSKSGTIKIGAALGITVECAAFGEGELKAARLAIEEVNEKGGILGKKIELIVEDTLCDSKGAINAMRKLIEVNKVEAIVGLTWGDTFQAGYTINNAAQVVSVAPSTALEALYRNKLPTTYVFSTWFSEKEEIDALQQKAFSMNTKKIVLVHDNDAFGAVMADLYKAQMPDNSLTLLKEYTLPVGDDDFRTIIAGIKQQHPEGVAIFFQFPSTKAKFLKQAQELGLKAQMFASADIEDPSLLTNFGAVMEGLIYTYPRLSGNKEIFFQKFKQRYGADSMGASDANAYDATNAIIAGLTDHYKNGIDLKTALERVDIPGTVTERIKFNSGHQVSVAKFEIKTVRNGKFVTIE